MVEATAGNLQQHCVTVLDAVLERGPSGGGDVGVDVPVHV